MGKVLFCFQEEDSLVETEAIIYYSWANLSLCVCLTQGDYTITARLTNEDRATVACADFTVKNYLDY